MIERKLNVRFRGIGLVMERTLTAQERKGLQTISDLQGPQQPVEKGDMPGIGNVTLRSLERLGVVAFVRTEHQREGYLVTEKGERVMYGKTMQEILEEGGIHHLLKVWKVAVE
jgi:hypothetical protein